MYKLIETRLYSAENAGLSKNNDLKKKRLKHYGFLTNYFSEQTILLNDRSVKNERNRWKMKLILRTKKLIIC